MAILHRWVVHHLRIQVTLTVRCLAKRERLLPPPVTWKRLGHTQHMQRIVTTCRHHHMDCREGPNQDTTQCIHLHTIPYTIRWSWEDPRLQVEQGHRQDLAN